jgi:hypothetical protein
VTRALAAGPRILLNELFGRLAAENRALLMTSHDLAGAARTCHRVVLMNRTVVAEGGPELLADPDQVLRAFGLAPAIGTVIAERRYGPPVVTRVMPLADRPVRQFQDRVSGRGHVGARTTQTSARSTVRRPCIPGHGRRPGSADGLPAFHLVEPGPGLGPAAPRPPGRARRPR